MNRGEVWSLSLDTPAAKNDAQSRLVIILSSDALAVLPLRVVVPLMAWHDDYNTIPWLVRIPTVLTSGLSEVMAADALQVRSVNRTRLINRLGNLPQRITDQVAAAVTEINS